MSDVQAELIYDDFRLFEIEVDTLAQLKITPQINESTGEAVLSPHLNPSPQKDHYKKTNIILAPDGSIVYPQSLYLVSKLRGKGKIKDTNSIAKALLLFTRFLDSTHSDEHDENGTLIRRGEHVTYKSLTRYEEEGAPWRFADFLLLNCRHRNSEGNEALALATARSYMSCVICFYKWLQKCGYIKNDNNYVVTHYSKVTVGNNNGCSQHDILAHTKSNKPSEVDMSNIMKMFPRADSTPAHKKLKPMTIKHQLLFYEHIEYLPEPFPLMFKLAVKTGTRIDELCHFPVHQIGEIDTSGLDVIPIRIIVTKFNKPRTIEVPITIYEELEIYRFSKQRMSNASKQNNLIESGNMSDNKYYLFLSNKGAVYSQNTLEKHFSNFRQHLINIDPTWYYRIHDCRSTFASNWLREEAEYREVSYDFLKDELAELMGHSDTSIIEKYVKSINEYDSQRSAAKRKNNKLNGVW